MKKLVLCLAVVSLLAFGGNAFAVRNTIDAVPAATLLLPYFEVNTANVNGVQTLFSINNASATAALAHVTVWSDWSIPVLDFDVYLTGYDIQTINLYDVLVLGNLPRTASRGQDPKDLISPQGPFSQDINFASCSATLPYSNPALSSAFRAHLKAALTGVKSPATGACYGEPYGDQILRGYVTVDTVNACNLFFPSDGVLYTPYLTFQNLLWGDYFYVNAGENFAQGDNLVHIEAFAGGFTPLVDHTFYGRYLAASAADYREPLPTTLGARYLNGGVFDGGTSFVTWREGSNAASAVTCGKSPSWYPLPFEEMVFFDEEEQTIEPEPCPSGDPTCTQTITSIEAERWFVEDFDLPFDFGWAYFNMQHAKIIAAYGDNDAQAWLTTIMDASGRFSVGFAGIQFDNANTPVAGFIAVE